MKTNYILIKVFVLLWGCLWILISGCQKKDDSNYPTIPPNDPIPIICNECLPFVGYYNLKYHFIESIQEWHTFPCDCHPYIVIFYHSRAELISGSMQFDKYGICTKTLYYTYESGNSKIQTTLRVYWITDSILYLRDSTYSPYNPYVDVECPYSFHYDEDSAMVVDSVNFYNKSYIRHQY